ncbi:uncharacterized protein LOC113076649 isoform X1 [Tachysurus ichikawai]
MTFPELNAKRRTDESFRQATDEEHHIQHSPLTDIGIDMVTCFPHDYMHLVCLGVMRRLLDLWISTTGSLHCRISSIQDSMVSYRLIALRNYIPCEFARRPRALADRCRWKATELRQFLLYTGPVVLNDVLQHQIYDNFMLLSVAVYILASPKFCMKMNDLANTLLLSFVEHFGQLYGEEFLVYNIHGLVHLSEDVKIHGNLDLISGFPFENFLGKLKKLVRGPCNPLTQVMRRLSEIENSNYNCDVQEAIQKLDKEHTNGPVPECFSQQARQFKVLAIDDIVVKLNERDSCVKIDNQLVLVQNIVEDEGGVYLVGNEYKQVEHFFKYPIKISYELGIYVVSNLSTNVRCFMTGKKLQKYVRLPFRNRFVVVPLLHQEK